MSLPVIQEYLKVGRLAFSLTRGGYSHCLRLQSKFYILLIRPGLSTVDLRANGRNNSRKCWELLPKNAAFVCTGLKVWPVSNVAQQLPTTRNIITCNSVCKRTQHVTSNNVRSCGPTMLRPFALGIKHTNVISNRAKHQLKKDIPWAHCTFLV